MKSDTPHPDTHCCYNCHFLTTLTQDHPYSPLDHKKRAELLKATDATMLGKIIGPNTKWGCLKDVWTHKPSGPFPIAPILTQERKDRCLFYPHTHKMTFDIAEVLEARDANRREAERDRDLTRHSLKLSYRAFKISIVALAVSIIATCATLAWNIWAHYHPHK